MILVGPRYEVRRVNRAGAAFVGMTPEELIGKSCCQLFCGRPDPRPDCPVAQVLRSGRPAAVEVVSANGDARTFHVRGYPVSGEQNGIRAVVEHRRDITEVKQSEERLIQVEKLRALGELAGGIAHDFNNVLAVVMGRADLLA
ncbi:MAG: PAS domain-containing protein, partial [Candidatus Rokubacteria bacterium]|nr:PAS domain-containing protein [Candidatus Rokubacteria bacterium]